MLNQWEALAVPLAPLYTFDFDEHNILECFSPQLLHVHSYVCHYLHVFETEHPIWMEKVFF